MPDREPVGKRFAAGLFAAWRGLFPARPGADGAGGGRPLIWRLQAGIGGAMRRPGVWWFGQWFGLASVCALWLAAVHFEAGAFERGLSARANAVVAERLGEGATAEASGRDIRIAGTLFVSSARDGAVAAVATLPGVRRVVDALSPPPPLAPYLWRAIWSGSVLTLAGATPSPAARTQILAAARQNFPHARLVDSMTYASGAPPGLAAQAATALRALGKLRSGDAQARDGRWTLGGEAANDADRDAALALATELGAGADASITPPPASVEASAPFALTVERTDKALVLSGACGDDAGCARIRTAARALFPGAEQQDSTSAAPGAPKDFLAAALVGLERLASLRSGRFSLRGQAAELSGEAGSAAEADAAKTGFVASMPEGFALKSNISGAERAAPRALQAAPDVGAAPPAPQERSEAASSEKQVAPEKPAERSAPAQESDGDCASRVGQLARATVVAFDYASAALSPEAAAALTALASDVLKCPQVELEISGHSDDIGTVSHNLDWSWRRAEAVAAFLLAAGVPPRRLRIDAFGETSPRAPNDSDENRAKNRRIELRVRAGS
jgi:OmpA-OmpF porin, OOP family